MLPDVFLEALIYIPGKKVKKVGHTAWRADIINHHHTLSLRVKNPMFDSFEPFWSFRLLIVMSSSTVQRVEAFLASLPNPDVETPPPELPVVETPDTAGAVEQTGAVEISQVEAPKVTRLKWLMLKVWKGSKEIMIMKNTTETSWYTVFLVWFDWELGRIMVYWIFPHVN